MTGKTNLELKVGIFAFIALAILTLAVFSISEIHLFEKGYEITVWFTFASGIEVGAPVRVAGIEVGEVKTVELTYDNHKSEARTWMQTGKRITDSLMVLTHTESAYSSPVGIFGSGWAMRSSSSLMVLHIGVKGCSRFSTGSKVRAGRIWAIPRLRIGLEDSTAITSGIRTAESPCSTT